VNHDPIEERLARLQPADLPSDLAARLAQAAPAARGKIRWLAFATPLAAAAVWMLLAHVATPPAAPSSAHAAKLQPSDLHVFAPVEERSYLLEERDLGVIDAEPHHPVRLVHQTWLDDTTYRGDDGVSSFRRTTPRAEIIPVMLEAY
jgi:hypothetical protein